MFQSDPATCTPSGVIDRAFAAQLGATRRPREAARTLPAACFAADEILALEREHLFRSAWHAVARSEDLPDAGCWRRVDVLGEDLLITRAADGAIHAHYNVCRHRGSRLVDAHAGQADQIRCPYHAWCYALDGRLTHVPQSAEVPDMRLRPVTVALWGGYVLVNLDGGAQAPPACWPDLPDLSAYGMPSLRRAHREVYEVRANWKLICQNYSECYHCPGTHPQLFRISEAVPGAEATGAAAAVFGDTCNGGPMRLREGVATMSMSGEARLPVFADLPEHERRLVHYFHVYPNLLLSPHPDYVLVHWVTPLAVDRTRVTCEWLTAAEALGDASAVADVVDFWDTTNRQDWSLCERNQAGITSRGYEPGPYHAAEACVHAFDAWYATRLGALLPPGAADPTGA
jgi:Rieske 2Fe-2S family protein